MALMWWPLRDGPVMAPAGGVRKTAILRRDWLDGVGKSVDPEALRAQPAYFERIEDRPLRHRKKFIGDAVLAVFRVRRPTVTLPSLPAERGGGGRAFPGSGSRAGSAARRSSRRGLLVTE